MIHEQPHPQAGNTVLATTKTPLFQQSETTVDFKIEDWWDHLTGVSWGMSEGNPAAIAYAVRSATSGLPFGDEVVYGHTKDGYGHLVHVSELEGV